MLSANNTLTTVLLAVLSLGYSLSGLAVEFASPVSYPVGVSPAAVVVADFNGDGKPDLAVANSGSGSVSVLVNNGDGTFKPAANFAAGMAAPTLIEVSDFNHDGIPDLAVWSSDPVSSTVSSTVSILLGNGDGTFQAPKATALPAAVDQGTLDLAIGDFNLDGKPDLIVLVHDANAGSSRILFLAGSGDGTFQAPQSAADSLGTVVVSNVSYVIGYNVRYLVAADFNGDGAPDLAVQAAGGIQILLGHGDGTFVTGPHLTLTSSPPDCQVALDLRAVDMNANGAIDLLATSFCSQKKDLRIETFSAIGLFLGVGDGSFQAEQIIDSGHFSRSLIGGAGGGSIVRVPTAADYNGDGKVDLAYVIGAYGTGVSRVPGLHLARSDGLFSSVVPLDASNPNLLWSSLVAKDLNGDKLSDLIIPDPADNAIVVELNVSPTSGADLGIIRATAGPPTDGISFAYAAEILNEGPQDATGVTFTEALPNGVTFVSATPTRGSCDQSNGTVTCAIGSLAAGFDATVTIAVTVRPTGTEETLGSNMKVAADEPDLELANNTAGPSATVFTLTVSTDGTGTGTVTSTPAGISCGAGCAQGYLSNSTVLLTATPAPGSVFTGWSNGGPCNGPATVCGVNYVQMGSSQTVTATFDKAPTPPAPRDSGSGGGGAFTWWEVYGMLLVGLWRRLSGSQPMLRG